MDDWMVPSLQSHNGMCLGKRCSLCIRNVVPSLHVVRVCPRETFQIPGYAGPAHISWSIRQPHTTLARLPRFICGIPPPQVSWLLSPGQPPSSALPMSSTTPGACVSTGLQRLANTWHTSFSHGNRYPGMVGAGRGGGGSRGSLYTDVYASCLPVETGHWWEPSCFREESRLCCQSS